MSEVQQKVPAQLDKSNGTGREMELSANEQAPCYLYSPVQKAIAQAKDQLAALHHQRATTVEGLQTLQASIEKATLAVNAADSTKLTNLHAKRRSFEERLEELASEEEVLTRHLEVLAQQEQQARVEDTARTRQQLQTSGADVATKLRQALVVVEGLYAEWRELKERDRITQDILRSLAPQRMTDLPDFSYACAVDQNFQTILGQVIVECRRSLADLQSRGQPLPAEMQERIEREQRQA